MPTYNEAGTIRDLLKAIRSVALDACVIIVDDNSPDETARIVADFAQSDSRVHLLSRSGKLGYASAVMAGLQFALAQGAEWVGYMDADFSHDPAAIPALLTAVRNGADIAIGSRYVTGGDVVGWSWQRRVLSKMANALVRFVLRLPVRDCTSGFRLFRRSALERLSLERVRVKGFAFQFSSLASAVGEGLRVVEVPVVFRERQSGRSKLSWRIVTEAVLVLVKMVWERRTGQRLSKPMLADG